MRLAIVGSRAYPELDRVRAYVATLPADTVIVSGGASGVDSAAAAAARAHGLQLVEHLPDYASHGARAPLVRNERIAADVDRLVAFHDGSSRGTVHVLGCARRRGIPCEVIGL